MPETIRRGWLLSEQHSEGLVTGTSQLGRLLRSSLLELFKIKSTQFYCYIARSTMTTNSNKITVLHKSKYR